MLPEHFSACHCCKRMSAHGFDTPTGLQSCCTISRRYKLSLRIKTNKNGGVKYTLIPKHELAAHAAFHFLCIQVACAHSFHIARVAPPPPPPPPSLTHCALADQLDAASAEAGVGSASLQEAQSRQLQHGQAPTHARGYTATHTAVSRELVRPNRQVSAPRRSLRAR